ncbi:hypothetical protein LOZ39_005683 [Ophidiomyces ophidiicola]|nr:hypothetical protein LOZ62_004496 [Ophidiomyces ophidiicola]KAI1968623.1 hypothetical protein LOZ56_004940 [Ophidiomyces ophidiicola]KAI2046565.1 hypothetical protein LOZ38_005320 [Ophidiomyces ophidiicola]KAI2063667.1 hypothetical protein LOZ40_005231 [Ophidiomyces ophidiicola]KAI2068613.1 hypothetical protein LOZ39_005683 [Ophidiomyces ophidiicola]
MAQTFILALLATTTAAAPSALNSRIVGGTAAKLGEFPETLLLSWRNSQRQCGAVLISDKVAVTAGYCLTERDGTALPAEFLRRGQLRVGSLEAGSGGTVYGLTSVTVHSGYNVSTITNDIGLIHLSTSVQQSRNVRKARLPAKGSDPRSGSTASILGWGQTVHGGQRAPVLLKVDAPIVDRETCRRLSKPPPANFHVTEKMICAGARNKSPCNGDSGGPIFDVATKNLIGIISAGRYCGTENEPSVFTRISAYLDWIEQNSKPKA